MPSDAASTLRDLRRLRTQRRLGDTEWFDVAYRVYLFALVGLTAVVMASDWVRDVIDDDVDTADVLQRGPATLGLIVAVAVAIGLRSGADGGPISIEVADIRHVLMAPVRRRTMMLRPVVQRLRSVAFAVALGAAILGQLVARELEGSRAAWAASGALFGAITGSLFVSTAVVAHAVRLPRWAASLLGAIVVGWQAAAAWAVWVDGAPSWLPAGPADTAGSVALWGIRQRGVDVAAIVVAAAAAGAAVALAGRLRIEPLARRGELVSQLRFAATAQDLRTVVILRRQLRAETLRQHEWFGGRSRRRDGDRRRLAPARAARGSRPPTLVWRRGVSSLRRLPASRLVRIAVLAAVAGVGGTLSVSASPLYVLLLLGAGFLVGLEVLEPLSQEIDRPDRTDGLPVDRGWLYVHHLVAPLAALAAAGAIGAAAATVTEPAHAAAAFALALPVAVLATTGAVVTTVLDASTPVTVANTTITGAPRGEESPFAVPEFAGASTALRTFAPVVVSATATLPVLLMRIDPSGGTIVRSAVGTCLFVAALVYWIRRRDRWAVSIRNFFAEGRAAAS